MGTVVNPEDRATAVLFGDGTVLIEHVEDESVGILDHVCHMNGEGEASLYIPAGGSVEPASAASVGERRHYVVQDGPAVYKAAVIGMAAVTEEILKRNDMTAADLAWLVPHQANRRIIEAVAKRLGLGLDRVIINLDRYGNTVAGRSLLRSRSGTSAGASRTATASSCRPSVRGSPPAASFCTGRPSRTFDVRPSGMIRLGTRVAGASCCTAGRID